MSMEAQLLEYGELTCHPQWTGSWQGPVHHKLYYVLGGNAYWRQNDVISQLKQGFLYVFPPLSCQLFHDPARPFEVLWFHIGAERLLTNKILGINPKEYPPMEMLLQLLRKALPGGGTVLKQLVSVLLSMLQEKNLLLENRCDGVDRAVDYIRGHLSKPLDNALLSKISGYNTHYFIRLFQRYTNKTPCQYVRSLRLEQARTLLLDGADVKAAAEACGIAPNTLSRDFKRYFGINASACRKQAKLLP